MAITTKYGITVGPDTPTQTDLDVFYSLGFGAIKLLCGVHSPNTVTAFRGVGAVILQARIHYPDIADGRTPEQFVNDRRDAIAAFIDAGLGDFEILNEPNLSREGHGRSWNSADGFNNWFLDALNRLKQIFPNARFGFPGLSPHPADYANDPAVNRPLRPVGDIDFLDACNDAVLAADFLCAHTYWQNVDQMREVDSNGMGKGGLRFVRFYHERFPTLPIVISEFCNNRPGIGDYAADDAQWRVIGDEYAEFYTLCAQYSWVQACFARTLRDAALPDQSWLTPNLEQRRIIEGVKARPPIPEPSQFKLRWPTQFRRINQDYGMRQNDYLRYSGGYLHGGHEGVDIAAPEGTDIYAALPGVVVRSEASRGNFAGGYGAYGEVIAVVGSWGREPSSRPVNGWASPDARATHRARIFISRCVSPASRCIPSSIISTVDSISITTPRRRRRRLRPMVPRACSTREPWCFCLRPQVWITWKPPCAPRGIPIATLWAALPTMVGWAISTGAA